jgi:hypothetical protein
MAISAAGTCLRRDNAHKTFQGTDTASRLAAGVVPDDGSLLSVTISSGWTCRAGAPLAVLGPRAALRSGRLALDDLGSAGAGKRAGHDSAGTAAPPPLPMSLSVVADQRARGALSEGRRASQLMDQDIR